MLTLGPHKLVRKSKQDDKMDETNNDIMGTQQRMSTDNNRNINEALANNLQAFKFNMGKQEEAKADIGEMVRSADKVNIEKNKEKFKEKERKLAKLQKAKEATNPTKQQTTDNKNKKTKQGKKQNKKNNNTTKQLPLEHDYSTPQKTQTELTSTQKNKQKPTTRQDTNPHTQITLDDDTSGEETEHYGEEERSDEEGEVRNTEAKEGYTTPQPNSKTDSDSIPPPHTHTP